MNKIIKYILNPSKILLFLDKKRIITLNDKIYLKLLYKSVFKKELDLVNPKTFNEKLQWLKLYDRKDIYTKMVDKFEAKEYVSNIIGEKYIIPTIGVYESFSDIDFNNLPNQFVMKCTHDSGGIIICKDKTKINLKQAKKVLNKNLKNNFYYFGREWPYKNIKPKIIIEKYMYSVEQEELIDYKFFCFNGIPKYLYISQGLSNHSTAKISFADMNYKKTDFYRLDYKQFDKLPKKPKKFNEMKEIAIKLSKGTKFLRVDLYEISNKIYFSELTFFPNSGYIPFKPEEYDRILGNDLYLY